MKVYLPRLDPCETHEWINLPADQLMEVARQDSVGAHFLTDDPAEADVILFTHCHMLLKDWRMSAILGHQLFQRYPGKTMAYDERDRPWCGVPGVYVSMPRRHFDPSYQRAWGYLRLPQAVETPPRDRDLLFSLVASPTHPCRESLYQLRHPDAHVQRVTKFSVFDASASTFTDNRRHFSSVIRRSRFVICPRGAGTSSFRMFEALAAGSVPVIISDEWVPPAGPRWDQFSIRWPEGQVDGLSDAISAADSNWHAMSTRAYRAYRDYFAPDVSFHHLGDQLQSLLSASAHESIASHSLRRRGYFSAGSAHYRSLVRIRVRQAARRALNRTNQIFSRG